MFFAAGHRGSPRKAGGLESPADLSNQMVSPRMRDTPTYSNLHPFAGNDQQISTTRPLSFGITSSDSHEEAMKEALRLDGQEFRDKPLKVVRSNKSAAAKLVIWEFP